MDIEALPLFDLSFEGYCRAVTEYALTANPDILTWITAIDRLRASGELVWQPPQAQQERQQRLESIHNMLKNSCINIFWYNKGLFLFTSKKFK